MPSGPIDEKCVVTSYHRCHCVATCKHMLIVILFVSSRLNKVFDNSATTLFTHFCVTSIRFNCMIFRIWLKQKIQLL